VPALAFSVSLFAEGSSDEQSLVSVTVSSLKLTFLILVPAVILVLAVADKLLLLFGSSYSESGTTLLRILALSALPIGINYIYLSMKRVEMKLALIIGLSAFIAVATLGLSYMLLPRMGISGVGIAWLSSHGVVAIGIAISFLLR
jgi:O-antigen/teichoic acid export membrane protein